MISVLDYGAGNLRSVANTLEAIGAPYELVRDTAGLARATKILLPGVGHFGQMMRALDQLEVRGVLIDRIRAGVPFFGICLGMQALFSRSDEAPEERGLGLFEDQVRRFAGKFRIPHMGWNSIELRARKADEDVGSPPRLAAPQGAAPRGASPQGAAPQRAGAQRGTSRLLAKVGAKPFVYFAHSYYAPVISATAATCDYTLPYTAVLEHENIFGVQFHPEKSGAVGQSIVRAFVEM